MEDVGEEVEDEAEAQLKDVLKGDGIGEDTWLCSPRAPASAESELVRMDIVVGADRCVELVDACVGL